MKIGPGRFEATSRLALWLAVLGSIPVHATSTQHWIVDPTELHRGFPDGVAITDKGRLFLAPKVEPLGEGAAPGDPLQAWSMVIDSRDNVYLGTGPDGQVVRIDPGGRQSIHFKTDEPLVTALAVLPDGDLLAGTSPGGKIYRITGPGQGVLFSETGRRYVWSLATDGSGRILAGTGELGEVLEIDSRGRAKPLFQGDEAHIVSLLVLPDGSVAAGGAGRGLVYRIDPDGHGVVIHDDDLAEVVALATNRDGDVIAATMAPPAKEVKPPAVRIRLPDGSQTTRQPQEGVGGPIDEAPGALIQGEIQGLPAGDQRTSRTAVRGRVVEIRPDGDMRILWRSQTEVPFALAVDSEDTIFFGTGEPARLYRVEAGTDVARLTTLPEAQLTGLALSGSALVAATSNPAATYRIVPGGGDSGVFVSPSVDAGAMARWGTIRWTLEHEGGRAEIYTRTGNSRTPDETWSGWGPALSDPEGSPVGNPDGRYLQWRARFVGAKAIDARLSSVRVSYEPYNRPPTVRELYVDAPGGAVSKEATVRWSTHDPDSDPVAITLEYRPQSDETWASFEQPQADEAETLGDDEAESRVDWFPDRAVLRTDDLDEGPYRVRAVASDEAANHPGEGRRVVVDHGLTFVVDRTAPQVSVEREADGNLVVVVRDDHSRVARLSVRQGSRTRFSARPIDGVCDSPSETFRFSLPEDSDPEGWSVRAVDIAGNETETSLVAP